MARLLRVLPGAVARRQQLGSRPAGERRRAYGVEHVVRGAQLRPGVAAALLPPQPLAVEQVSAGEFGADRRAGQVR